MSDSKRTMDDFNVGLIQKGHSICVCLEIKKENSKTNTGKKTIILA